ncbi:Protein suppresor of PHYA-105 1 [Apostasia shenzhenica]|uniref:Protein suppresor of PHYA-105 1 n=1 Tax=Apostasia shenzhenica TaxID=1088818 RepID=A0A2I0B8X3_9ASPA|nr:Protein suppresor of PHYA-105 1 [Apostasia shenzhenica]
MASMDGSALNHSAHKPAESPQLKRKEKEELPQELDSRIALQNPASVITKDTDWDEHFSSLRSPEIFLEAMAAKSVNLGSGSNSVSEYPSSSPFSSGYTGATVEELTMRDFNTQNACKGDCSTSGEDSSIRSGFWQNWTRVAGKSRLDSLPKEPLGVADRGEAGESLKPLMLLKRPLQLTQVSTCNSNAPQNTSDDHNQVLSRSILTRQSHEIRTKVLNASRFRHSDVMNSSKGKGIAFGHQGVDCVSGLVAQSQNKNVTNENMQTTEGLCKSIPKADETTLAGGSGGCVESNVHPDGTSLRKWLKSYQNKSNKFEKLLMFKQILEFVDTSHSECLVLQNLQPSYFVVLRSGLIKYIGLLSRKVKPGLMMDSANQNDMLESNLKRRRSVEHGMESQVALSKKQSKLHHGTIADGIIKYGQDFSGQVSQAEPNLISKISGTTTNPSSDLQKSLSEFLKLEDTWYTSPEELNEGSCPFSSNVYSLGILLFEFFCYFEMGKLHFAAMSNVRHRILPPSFLSEYPKEAGFCLWLLHPDPYSRPNSREILSSDFLRECDNVYSMDKLSTSTDEDDAEADLLLHFLSSVMEEKGSKAAKLNADIQCLEADIKVVERRHSSSVRSLSNVRSVLESCSDISDIHTHEVEGISARPVSGAKEENSLKNIDQLEHAYFSMRYNIELSGHNVVARSDVDVLKFRDNFCQLYNETGSKENSNDRLGAFFEGLCKYARYSKFEVCGSLRNVDILNSANVICSLSFDRDEDYFAAAGVSKKIKIFDFGALLDETVDVHYPLIEMSSKYKLSCVSWNTYIKNYLASTDYDGVVQLWDAGTGQGFTQYVGHEKRAWSVDFSPVDPTKLASGSDDCSVKLWSIRERDCIDTIRTVANVCCVQFSPYSSNLLSFGTADYKILCYDLRNTRNPWCALSGHGKAVSYVKFVDYETLVSASTDGTLKLWDLKKTNASGLSTNACSMTFSGHKNEKNFVGLSAFEGYIACGSETNEVYAYYKALPMSITSHKFGSIDPITGEETGDDNGQFVSSVCWRTKSSMIVSANSSGSLKLLRLV